MLTLSTLSLLLLSATSLSTSLVIPILTTPDAGASKLLSDLQTVNSDFRALAQADKDYAQNGNATAVQARVTQADIDNDLTVLDATLLTSPLTSEGGQAIIDYINDTLEPSIKAAIDATVANKAQVAKAGVAGLLAVELRELKQDNDNIGVAIGGKIGDAGQVAGLKAVIAKIDADYDYGIGQFS